MQVETSPLYVEDGPVITSAGCAAAIDLCLHLIRRERGAQTANSVARQMVAPPHRSGGQSQYVEMPVPGPRADGELGAILHWAQQHLGQPLTTDALAVRASMSARTFARRFRQQTGTTPHQWLTGQRLLLASRLLERGNDTIASIASHSGFGSPDSPRRHFARAFGVTPDQYRRTFQTVRRPPAEEPGPPWPTNPAD